MADVCGPWTLEGLDSFGSIDSLAFSLDDAVWESAGTCILDGAAEITAAGSVQTSLQNNKGVTGLIAGQGFISSDILAIRTFNAEIAGSGNVSSSLLKETFAQASIEASAELTAQLNFPIPVDAFFNATGNLNGSLLKIAGTSATVTSNGLVYSVLYKFGEEWVIDPDESNSWTEIPSQSNFWTEQAAGNNTWQRLA